MLQTLENSRTPSELTKESTTPRQTHNYTSELELKSLLIRIINDQKNQGSLHLNERINERIKKHTYLGELKLDPNKSPQRNILRRRMYQNIVELSEQTRVNYDSYERFGEIILLMIQRILTRPNFSGYSYRHDFYSDAVYKIIKYLHNFDHNLISERSGLPVNAFAYISQYIHNSVIYIIGRHKKENDGINAIVKTKNSQMSSRVRSVDISQGSINIEQFEEVLTEDIFLDDIESLTEELRVISENSEYNSLHRLNIYYPCDYVITFEEYNDLRQYLNPNISIIRSTKETKESKETK